MQKMINGVPTLMEELEEPPVGVFQIAAEVKSPKRRSKLKEYAAEIENNNKIIDEINEEVMSGQGERGEQNNSIKDAQSKIEAELSQTVQTKSLDLF